MFYVEVDQYHFFIDTSNANTFSESNANTDAQFILNASRNWLQAPKIYFSLHAATANTIKLAHYILSLNWKLDSCALIY